MVDTWIESDKVGIAKITFAHEINKNEGGGGGSERPAAYTQQKLIQVPPGLFSNVHGPSLP